jgi:hypothetical protein
VVQENPRIPMPTVGIDLDGTITDAPGFFTLFCNRWPGDIIIVTYRPDVESAKRDLDKYDIRYDEIVLVKSLEDIGWRLIRSICRHLNTQSNCFAKSWEVARVSSKVWALYVIVTGMRTEPQVPVFAQPLDTLNWR